MKLPSFAALYGRLAHREFTFVSRFPAVARLRYFAGNIASRWQLRHYAQQQRVFDLALLEQLETNNNALEQRLVQLEQSLEAIVIAKQLDHPTRADQAGSELS